MSCEIEKWKFPQNVASEYQLSMVRRLGDIYYSSLSTHWWKQDSHHSCTKIRLMRGFEASDFFRLFFSDSELGTKEFESFKICLIVLPRTRGRVFDIFRTCFYLLWDFSSCLHFWSHSGEEGHAQLISQSILTLLSWQFGDRMSSNYFPRLRYPRIKNDCDSGSLGNDI